MVISEQDRNDLHNGLAEVLGAQRAAVLMEHLPPVGWADVATKRDIDALKSDLAHTEAVVRADFRSGLSELRADLTKTFVLSLVTTNLTLIVAVLGYVQLVLK